ncbi:ANL_HP_G0132510.mRNA.1.CDS.1 [Saccharomyces cerevisiae]|nr:ANL_HP_G0203800.mRNA.1.CDS.1 [Saccharomyces cerevisiae]CAI5047226.1 ANL_HP_G0088130.mRNA.1.CDS.1 [Saccharomyces cerevisiae]CAI5182951.1 ANL_HP_G0132510.mRNA.1.CDS.1 [Saccharomyces cerevisiae]CAI6496236.1 ANL_HP_G0203800.mRNA.1.CDS.1 [Saccharomyces cerevisiae]CAI6956800.1 ANL_HP_G0088130.mRNA.1.CDS.1 [Saccharomyces cerevisiae]
MHHNSQSLSSGHIRSPEDQNVAPIGNLKHRTGSLSHISSAHPRVALSDVTNIVATNSSNNSISKPKVAPIKERLDSAAIIEEERLDANSVAQRKEADHNDLLTDREQEEPVEDDGESEEDEEEDQEPLVLQHYASDTLVWEHAFRTYYRTTLDPNDDDVYDVVMVAELSNEIFEYMRKLEDLYKPNPYYMDKQPELRWSFRSTLIDWIVQVHEKFQLLPETLYLCINIIDRYLCKEVVPVNKFQLVGAASLFIAAKYEEINCPTIKDFVYMSENCYSRNDLLDAERTILNGLEFELGWPGPMSFLRRISKADDYEHDTRTLAKYLLESTIMDHRLVSAQPSWLAAGAYFLSKIILGQNQWSLAHVYYSNYTQEQILPLATIILENCRYASKRHNAIWRKYSSRRYLHSSQIVAKWIALAEHRVERSN